MNYKIKHTMVGPFPEGRVVDAETLQESGANVGRLIGLGAIEQVDEEVSEDPLPNGPENLNTGEGGEGGGEEQPQVALDDMKIEELRELAKQYDLQFTTRTTKKDLVAAIAAAQEAATENPPEA